MGNLISVHGILSQRRSSKWEASARRLLASENLRQRNPNIWTTTLKGWAIFSSTIVRILYTNVIVMIASNCVTSKFLVLTFTSFKYEVLWQHDQLLPKRPFSSEPLAERSSCKWRRIYSSRSSTWLMACWSWQRWLEPPQKLSQMRGQSNEEEELSSLSPVILRQKNSCMLDIPDCWWSIVCCEHLFGWSLPEDKLK